MPHDHAHHGHGHGHGAGEPDPAEMAELLALDAEVLAGYHAALADWVRAEAGDRPRRKIVDLGTGIGVGAVALAERFPEAQVTAVDVAAALLEKARGRAAAHGVTERIQFIRADLDAGFPDFSGTDLLWMSNALHHLADPDKVLADIRGALAPEGLFVLMELRSFPRFLPHDLGIGAPGLEDRLYAAQDEARQEALPHIGADWGARLRAAGFGIVAQRDFTIALDPPQAGVGRYAQASLKRMRGAIEDRIDPDDLATLDALVADDGPASVLHRSDIGVRAARSGWVSRVS